MSDFLTLPDGPLTLADVTVPACCLGEDESAGEGLVRRDIAIADGRIADACEAGAGPRPGRRIEMGGAMALPAFVDMHTHLDKGHIWPRKANPDGTFDGALNAVAADRAANWSAEDVRRRMDFALRCAWAHGTRAIRTHLDSIPPQDAITWPVFREVRAEWEGRIALQGVNLVHSLIADRDGPMAAVADCVAEAGGVLGMVTLPVCDLPDRLRYFFSLATERGLAADFHVDETGDASVATLRQIAEAVIETGFEAPVTVGHCCSLARQDPTEARRTMDLVARAGLNVVCLPMCNLYLQDRGAGATTPRWRGITLVHEMKERGINVCFASDNTRDPFYAYGDLDMLEVMREAVRIGHLDHSGDDWPRAFAEGPARACGMEAPGLTPGAPADLVIARARSWTELFARPQADRIVLRGGRRIDRTLPDYAELDDLMEGA